MLAAIAAKVRQLYVRTSVRPAPADWDDVIYTCRACCAAPEPRIYGFVAELADPAISLEDLFAGEVLGHRCPFPVLSGHSSGVSGSFVPTLRGEAVLGDESCALGATLSAIQLGLALSCTSSPVYLELSRYLLPTHTA